VQTLNEWHASKSVTIYGRRYENILQFSQMANVNSSLTRI